MADKFFEEEQQQEEEKREEKQEAPSKIKVAGGEYTQEELERLVGLGKVGLEAEEKFNTKLDRVWPDYTKKSQRVAELEAKLAEIEQQQLKQKAEEGQQLSPDEIKRQALTQADELGLIHRGNVQTAVLDVLRARDLIDECEAVVEETAEEGKPKTSVDALLRHMEETGIRKPDKAYKDMFEIELEALREQKLKTIKQPGLVTESGSTAGAKSPRPVTITRDNLTSVLGEVLGREE